MTALQSAHAVGAPGPLAYRAGLAAYLEEFGDGPATVSEITAVTGGNARPTWRCDIIDATGSRGVILRVKGGTELGLSDFRHEYDALTLAFQAGLLVPEPLVYSDDERWLGAPFMLIAEIPDGITTPSGFGLDPALRADLGRDFWAKLGEIAAAPVDGAHTPDTFPPVDPGECAARELAHWRASYERTVIEPHPVAAAALRWMERQPASPAQKIALVHGDYRLGNMLHDEDGRLSGILDWEMAHLGDPLEDLAWTLDPRQDANNPALAAGLLPHAEAVAQWEQSSGLRADPAALLWWQVFVAFKALTIWTVAAHGFVHAEDKRTVDGRMGWLLVERQARVLLDLISPLSAHVYYRHGS